MTAARLLPYDKLHERPIALKSVKSLRSETAMSNEEILKVLRELVAEQFAKEPEDITMDTSFEGDLGADSVDLVELVMAMEEE